MAQRYLLQTKLALAANIDAYYYSLKQYKATSGILYCNWIRSVVCQEQSNIDDISEVLQNILAQSECENLSSVTIKELNCFF